jgi:ATP-binding cassette subfamily B protein
VKNNAEFTGLVSLVPQDPYLFTDLLERNISFEEKLSNPILFQKSVQLANVISFVDLLPEKYNTFVSSQTPVLSYGQKQRVTIARALYQNNPILIFDEPTSSLDDNASQDFVNTIAELKKEGYIIIASSHKSDLLQIADNVIDLTKFN